MNFTEFITSPDYEGWSMEISEKHWGYNIVHTYEQAVRIIGWRRTGEEVHARLFCDEAGHPVEHGSACWLIQHDGSLKVRRVSGACEGLAEQYNRSLHTFSSHQPIPISHTQGGTNEPTNRIHRNRCAAHRRARHP